MGTYEGRFLGTFSPHFCSVLTALTTPFLECKALGKPFFPTTTLHNEICWDFFPLCYCIGLEYLNWLIQMCLQS